jgi:hypothetical protein
MAAPSSSPAWLAHAAASPEEHGWLLCSLLGWLCARERARVLAACRALGALPRFAGWARWQCGWLADEFALYCPPRAPRCKGEERAAPHLRDELRWAALARELWAARGLWAAEANGRGSVRRDVATDDVGVGGRIKVFARLKPRPRGLPSPSPQRQGYQEQEQEQSEELKVNLPLHQRVALVKASGAAASTSDALRLLVRAGQWWGGQSEVSKLERQQQQQSGVFDDQVAAACAALGNFSFQVQAVDAQRGVIVMATPIGVRDFVFDGVLEATEAQAEVYERCAQELVTDVLNGRSATLFVYGQTGSGKTFTMFGGNEWAASGVDERGAGVVPRVCEELFAALSRRRGVRARVRLSYVEVYGQQVLDLLNGGQAVGHAQAAAQRLVLEGQAAVPVHDEAELRRLLQRGEAFKTRARTLMNERSTRAHTLLAISVALERGGAVVESSLFLGDLCGSERVKKSKVTGEQLDEALHINRGLSALHRVVMALNLKSLHVPYADSKLTMLLARGLGGRSRTCVVVCADQDPRNAAETLNALRFGADCAMVKNRDAGSALSRVVALVKALDLDIAQLEQQIRAKERWETREARRVDSRVESGTFEAALAHTGGEVVGVSRLVGAEREHVLLADLVKQRRQLLGMGGDDATATARGVAPLAGG